MLLSSRSSRLTGAKSGLLEVDATGGATATDIGLLLLLRRQTSFPWRVSSSVEDGSIAISGGISSRQSSISILLLSSTTSFGSNHWSSGRVIDALPEAPGLVVLLLALDDTFRGGTGDSCEPSFVFSGGRILDESLGDGIRFGFFFFFLGFDFDLTASLALGVVLSPFLPIRALRRRGANGLKGLATTSVCLVMAASEGVETLLVIS